MRKNYARIFSKNMSNTKTTHVVFVDLSEMEKLRAYFFKRHWRKKNYARRFFRISGTKKTTQHLFHFQDEFDAVEVVLALFR